MRPIILISAEDGIDERGKNNMVLSQAYSNAIIEVGGIPVTALDIRAAEEYARIADGLLLTGGPRIHPARYGDIIKEKEDMIGFSQARDNMDFTLGRLFLSGRKPILGVGRGAMVINVLFGGTIETHLPAQGKAVDHFRGVAQSLLGERIQFPRQYSWGIGALGDGMEAVAVSQEGIVDGIFHTCDPVWGVTWHPERELDGCPPDNRLFQLLVREAAQ